MGPRVLACCAALVLAASAFAGRFNDVLDIGSPAPAWVELPGVDGKKHSLADLKDKEAVVVVFTCNSCPAAVDYLERIARFTKKHAGPDGKVALVAINVNKIPEDSLPKMIERARDEKFDYPYLYDATQRIAKLYGAVYTPEFFVLDQKRNIAYMGAFDDKDNPAVAKVNFLENAVEAVLAAKKSAVTETLGRGCKIRYERKKD